MENIPRIGKWTAQAALESAMEMSSDEDALMVVAICKEDNTMRFWTANCSNMQANWMADNIKFELMGGQL